MTTDLCLQMKEINYKNYVLIWLEDSQVDFTNRFGSQLTIVQTFQQCEEYIRTISIYDRIYVLFHSRFIQDFYSYKNNIFERISTIFIYGEQQHVQIDDDERIEYIENLNSDDFLSNRIQSFEPFAFLLYKPSLTLTHSISFFHFQVILNCLLHLQHNNNSLPNHTHLITLLRNIYPDEKNTFDQFEQTYSSDRAIEICQQNTCLSKLFNKILCLTNINCLFLYRFYLHDLEQQIKSQQTSSIIHCYQMKYLSNEQIDSIRHSIGDFLSINSFLIAKLNRQDIQLEQQSSDKFKNVLFEIELNSHSERPYAQLTSSDVFIMCGSIFRILDLRLDDNQHWIVQLKSYGKTDDDLKFVFNSIEEELDYDEEQIDLITFGTILWKMKKINDEEIYFRYLLDILAEDHIDRANIYYNLGHIYSEKSQFDLSLKYYEKSLDIWKNCPNSNEINLANNYNAIATYFWKQSDYQQAYEAFHKALEIFRHLFGDHHITVGMCWNNLGTVISNENDSNSNKILDCYLKALHIFQENLPIHHPNLASLHCNISRIYKKLEQYDQALEHLNLSLKIYEHSSLPSRHSNICVILKNIAYLYEQKQDFQSALNFYERINRIYRQTHAENDPLVQENQEKIQNLSAKLTTKTS